MSDGGLWMNGEFVLQSTIEDRLRAALKVTELVRVAQMGGKPFTLGSLTQPELDAVQHPYTVRNRDGRTYWYSDRKCADCGQPMATDGNNYFCDCKPRKERYADGANTS